jgi:transcriptional regulator of acetoin/glycerol metabolism
MLKELTQRTSFYDVWSKFISKGDVNCVPIHVRRSWERCREANVDPQKEANIMRIDQNSIRKRIDEHSDLHQLLQAHYKNVEKYFSFLPLCIFFSDRDGYILSIIGHDRVLGLIRQGQQTEIIGSSIKERIIGTTAPGICLEEKRFATVNAEEHYIRRIHWASCIATPIFDWEQNLLGCLDFTVTVKDAEKLKHLIPVLLTTANSIQFELSLKKKLEQLDLFHCYYRSTFDYSRSTLILVDRRGRIIDLNRNAQEAFNVNSECIKNKDVRSILGDKSDSEFLFKKFGGSKSLKYRTSGLYSTESIPIFDRSGNEVAFLLKLEKEKAPKAIPGGVPHTARHTFEGIIGTSPKTLNIVEKAKKAAKGGSNILLEGETGTGKELFAHAIHDESSYCGGPFVALNCAAIPSELIESELFGYERGAFTGALHDGNTGKFELANGGTIFLDEIHAMDLSAQTKILRVIEDRQVTRIGGKYAIPLNIRIIVASSTNLEEKIERGLFIPGLFYRLNVVRLSIPSLRERREDIPSLVDYFISEMNLKFNRSIRGVEPEVLEVMFQYSWPGNVRELRNCIESAFNFCVGEVVSLNDLEDIVPFESKKKPIAGRTMSDITKDLMMESLSRFGNVGEAANSLGIPKSTFYRKMKKFE